MARKALITLQGWDGKWWRKIKVGRAVWDAGLWVLPLKVSIALAVGEAIGEELKRGAVRRSR